MRRSNKILIAVALFFILFFAFLPTLISTPLGTKVLVSTINGFSKGNLYIDRLHLRWFGKQELSHLVYIDKEEREIFFLKEATTTRSYLLFGRFGEITLKDLSFTIHSEEAEEIAQQKRAFTFPRFLLRSPLHIENGRILIQPREGAPSIIQNIQLQLDIPKQQFSLQAEGVEGIHKGTIVASGLCCHPLHVEAKISHFPLSFFTAFEELRWLPHALGSELSADLLLTRPEGSSPQLNATLNSTYLQATIKGEKEGDFFAISPESHIQWQLTPPFFKEWFALPEGSSLFLADKVPLTIEPKKILIPLDQKKFTLENSQINAHLKAESLTLIYKEKGYLISHFDASLVKERDIPLTLNYQGTMYNKYNTTLCGSMIYQNEGAFSLTTQVDRIPSTILEDLSSLHGAITPYGESVALTLNLSQERNKINATLQMKAELASLLIEACGKRWEDLAFTVEGTLLFQGDKKELLGESLALYLEGRTTMKEGVFNFATLQGHAENPYLNLEIRGNLGNANLPFSWDLTDLVIKGTIETPPLFNLGDNELRQPHPLYLHIEGCDNEILFNVDLSLLKIEGAIFGFIQEKSLDFSKAEWKLTASGEEMPVAIISTFFPQFAFLSDLLAPKITFQSEIIHQKKEPHTSINVDAKAEGFSLSGMLTLNGNLKVSQEKPMRLQYEITPERIDALLQRWPDRPLPPFLLAAHSLLDFTITSFTCPTQYPGNVKEFLCKSGFSGELTLTPLIFVNEEEQKQYTLEKIHGKLSGENFSRAIAFNLDSLLTSNVEERSHLPFRITGNIFYLFTEKGEWNFNNSEIKGEFSLESFPSELLFGIFPLDIPTREVGEALLGENVTASGNIDIRKKEGPIQLSLQASNFKAKCPLYLKAGYILLSDTLEAEIELTHKINEAIIKDINPILISGIYSNHPLRLKINPESFSLPLFPFSIRGINIKSAILDIGKIEVVYGGEIEKIMEFVKSEQKSETGVMSAWFTPIYFALHDGNLIYERFDLMLAGNVHLAFWGKIDLNKDKVHMMMAIGAGTLQRSFGIKGLSSKEMFQVKMRGSTSNVELDWSAAKRRIGVIVATSAAGPIGLLVGGILEKIVTNLGEAPSPPPTTQPFPWES